MKVASPCCSGYVLIKYASFGVFECERCHRTYPIQEIEKLGFWKYRHSNRECWNPDYRDVKASVQTGYRQSLPV